MYITAKWYIVSSPAVNRVPWAVLGVDPVSWTPHGWGGRHDADKETFGETSYRPVPRLRHCWYCPRHGMRVVANALVALYQVEGDADWSGISDLIGAGSPAGDPQGRRARERHMRPAIRRRDDLRRERGGTSGSFSRAETCVAAAPSTSKTHRRRRGPRGARPRLRLGCV